MPEVPSLGARGGGWVALQLALIAAIVAALLIGPPWPEPARTAFQLVGAALAIGGVVLAVVSSRLLGAAFTMFPRPAARGALVERGPYRFVRHPVYAGGLLVFVGCALARSPVALVPTLVLAVVWGLKARLEERYLGFVYPGYRAYAERTRYRIVPFVY